MATTVVSSDVRNTRDDGMIAGLLILYAPSSEAEDY